VEIANAGRYAFRRAPGGVRRATAGGEPNVDTEHGPIVNVAWLMARIGRTPGLKVVDARNEPAYREAHIPGALHWDLHHPRLPNSSPDAVAQFDRLAGAEIRRLGIERGDRVIFYEDYSGASAARGVWLLDYLGIGNGAMLNGGLNDWYSSGGELTTEMSEVVPSRTEILPDPDTLALAGEIVAGIADGAPPFRVLDTRNRDEYRAGTVPSSVHLDWAEHLNDDGSVAPLDVLAETYREVGLDPDSPEPVVTFCGSGYRAAHAYVVLKALGFPAVKNYVPSWGEWGRHPNLPVEYPAD
jgi:thiosulfate/3-mercaptopyruvate sulfurtransferase